MSAYIGLADVQSLPDPQMSYQFNLLFPNIPGQGSGRPLAIRCKSSSIPGQEIEKVPVQLHGVELEFAGRPTYDHAQQATFLETRDFVARNTIRQWMDFCKNIRNGTGNYALQYKTVGIMQLYDDASAVTKQIQLIGCWPTTMSSVSVSGESSNAIELEVTFSYDLWTDLS